MRVLFFGTYDTLRHPRVSVLIEGFLAHGDEVAECNVPLGLATEERIELARKPWKAARLARRLLRCWPELTRRARRLLPPDLVVVGYLGLLDVHLAKRLWPTVPIVLDQLIFAADTARDRRIDSIWKQALLHRMDETALRTADVIAVDTIEHAELVPEELRSRAVVVPVGAPSAWFRAPVASAVGPLKVVFYGLFTPLQGTATIGTAMDRLSAQPISFTVIGRGQDYDRARQLAASNLNVNWIDWVSADELPALVHGHDVCLGIFGSGAKARRVVPNKVYQGAAAGCAIVTSDSTPQIRALGDSALYVRPDDPAALADALLSLERDRARLSQLKNQAHACASESFVPRAVVQRLREVVEIRIADRREGTTALQIRS